MQLIRCPWCGPREEAEYHYGGQAHVAYPESPAETSDVDWAQYVFFRDNPKGPFAERWVHAAGCRRWFNAVRDTATHELLAVYRMGEPRPAVPRMSEEPILTAQALQGWTGANLRDERSREEQVMK